MDLTSGINKERGLQPHVGIFLGVRVWVGGRLAEIDPPRRFHHVNTLSSPLPTKKGMGVNIFKDSELSESSKMSPVIDPAIGTCLALLIFGFLNVNRLFIDRRALNFKYEGI